MVIISRNESHSHKSKSFIQKFEQLFHVITLSDYCVHALNVECANLLNLFGISPPSSNNEET